MRPIIEHSTSPPPKDETSIYMTVFLFFITHGMVNALILAFSPLRCAYWKRQECNEDENWMMNWLAYNVFHVYCLLACLARTAHRHMILEQRLLILVTIMMFSTVSTGVFMLDHVNQNMAGVQIMVYVFLLILILYHNVTSPFVVPLPAELRSSSHDYRQKLPVATVALLLQFVLSSFQVWDMTFGNGRHHYLGDWSGPVFSNISQAAVAHMLWVAIIMAFGLVLGTPDQQRALLQGEAVCLSLCFGLLWGGQGAKMEATQTQAASIGTFFSILISVAGAG